MRSPIFFALCVALMGTSYQIFQKLTAGISAYLVAIVVSVVAILTSIFLVIAQGKQLLEGDPLQWKTWIFLIFIGISAFGIDFFTSRAYATGGNISVISPVITSGIVVFSSVVGIIFFREPITVVKIVGVTLISIGTFCVSWSKYN